MRRMNLKRLTVDELVQHFASLAVEQDDALLDGNISKINRLVLETRGGGSRA